MSRGEAENQENALTFRLFGTFEVRLNGQPLPPPRYRKEWWLLSLLVLWHDREISRDWLAAAFWPDSEERQALYYLRRSLTNLRRALGAEADRLQSPTPRTLRFDLASVSVDVIAFNALLERASREPNSEDLLQEAIALYRAPLLHDCPEPWAIDERETHEQGYLNALETLAKRVMERGEPAAAVPHLRLLLTADPYREHAVCSLMQALADCGDHAAITHVYRDFRLRLHTDLHTAPAADTESLYRRLMQQEIPSAVPAPAAPVVSNRHLPVPLTSLIGREQEKEEIIGWLRRSRLVTLLGAGGVGKTRLAIAVADAVLPHFPDGVWFADLAALNDPALLPDTIVRALGIKEQPGFSPTDLLTHTLSAQMRLVVLDNCEHLADACAMLFEQLAAACPYLRLLATSRQALHITGEQSYRVPSLSLPFQESESYFAVTAQEKDPYALLEYDAIRLFVERATQINTAFRLTRRNADAVVLICRHLDGIPLAIEMAAARTASLSPHEILTRLEDRFRFLTTGSRSARPRQQTLLSLIEWSYDLLSEKEKRLFRCLSVFAGGWTLETAEALCGDARGLKRKEATHAEVMHQSSSVTFHSPILDLLASLVDRSLVIYSGGEEQSRYGMLESIRQYGKERLQAAGEYDEVRQRHCDTYLRFTEKNGRSESDPARHNILSRLETEYANIRLALDYCLEHPAHIETGLRLLIALSYFWISRGYFAEGLQRCAAFLSHPQAQERTTIRGGALCVYANMAYYQCDYQRQHALAEEALSIQREGNDLPGIARALGVLGGAEVELRDFERSRLLREESLLIWRQLGDQKEVAAMLHNLGVVAREQRDFARARKLLDESLSIRRDLQDRQGVASVLHVISWVDYFQGDYVAARDASEESFRINQEIGNRTWGAFNLRTLGWVHLALENIEETHAACAEALELQKELGSNNERASLLECLAELAHFQRQYLRAVCLWSAAERLRRAIGRTIAMVDHERYSRKSAEVRMEIGEEGFAAAWEKGQQWTEAEATAFALQREQA